MPVPVSIKGPLYFRLYCEDVVWSLRGNM